MVAHFIYNAARVEGDEMLFCACGMAFSPGPEGRQAAGDHVARLVPPLRLPDVLNRESSQVLAGVLREEYRRLGKLLRELEERMGWHGAVVTYYGMLPTVSGLARLHQAWEQVGERMHIIGVMREGFGGAPGTDTPAVPNYERSKDSGEIAPEVREYAR